MTASTRYRPIAVLLLTQGNTTQKNTDTYPHNNGNAIPDVPAGSRMLEQGHCLTGHSAQLTVAVVVSE
jgi:hypothetical protein